MIGGTNDDSQNAMQTTQSEPGCDQEYRRLIPAVGLIA